MTITGKYVAAFLIGAAIGFAFGMAPAYAENIPPQLPEVWQACGTHNGRYFCTQYIGITGCDDSNNCERLICEELPASAIKSDRSNEHGTVREHCDPVPMPKARPVIPCDTDSDCMLKNGGNGDPVNAQCFDPQDDETFGENGILCRDGESY